MIFISYNKNDLSIVEPTALLLQKMFGKNDVFFAENSIDFGDSIPEKMSFGLDKQSIFVLFLSKNSLESNAVKAELNTAFMKQFSKDNLKLFITIKLDNCEIPSILKPYKYINFSDYENRVDFTNDLQYTVGKHIARISKGFSNYFGILYFFKNRKKIKLELEPLEDNLRKRFFISFLNDPENIKIGCIEKHERIRMGKIKDVKLSSEDNSLFRRNGISLILPGSSIQGENIVINDIVSDYVLDQLLVSSIINNIFIPIYCIKRYLNE